MAYTIKNGLGVERLTVSTVAVALAAVPHGATYALVRCKNAAVCFTDDGVTVPTASVGMEVEAGEIVNLDSRLSQFKAIRRDAVDAILVVNYYGPNG